MVLAPPIYGNCYEIIFLLSNFLDHSWGQFSCQTKTWIRQEEKQPWFWLFDILLGYLICFPFAFPIFWFCLFVFSVGNVAHYSSELTERVRSNNATSNGVRMQFKSPINRNTTSRNNFEKNVSKSPLLINLYVILFFCPLIQ